MNNTRRTFLRRSLASAVTLALGGALLRSTGAMAAWTKEAFEAKQLAPGLTALLGGADATESGEVQVKAPDIAENGAVVPVTVSTTLTGVESITVVASNNPSPIVAHFLLGPGARPTISTRIKMGKTGDVVAVIKAGGKLFSARKEVKVTIGGCGG